MTTFKHGLYEWLRKVEKGYANSVAKLRREPVQNLPLVDGEKDLLAVYNDTLSLSEVEEYLVVEYNKRFEQKKLELCRDIASGYIRNCMDHWSDRSQQALDFSRHYLPVESRDYRFGIDHLHTLGLFLKEARPANLEKMLKYLAPTMPLFSQEFDESSSQCDLSLSNSELLLKDILKDWLNIAQDQAMNWGKLTVMLMISAYIACRMVEVAGYNMKTGVRIYAMAEVVGTEMMEDGAKTLFRQECWDSASEAKNAINNEMLRPVPDALSTILSAMALRQPLPENALLTSPNFPGVCPPADPVKACLTYDKKYPQTTKK